MPNLKSFQWLKVVLCLWGGLSSLAAKGAEPRASSDHSASLNTIIAGSYQGYDLRALAALTPAENEVANPPVVEHPEPKKSAPPKKKIAPKSKKPRPVPVVKEPVTPATPAPVVVHAPVNPPQELVDQNEELTSRITEFRLQQDALYAALNTCEKEVMGYEAKTALLQTKVESLQRKAKEKGDDKQLSALKAQNDDLTQQLAALKQTQAESPKAPAPLLNTDEQKRDYVLGQAMVSELNKKSTVYHQLGIDLDKKLVLSGMQDGLEGKERLNKQEMDKSYLKFTQLVGRQVNAQVATAEQKIKQQIKGKKNTQTVNGITYSVVNKGEKLSKPYSAVTVSLSEEMLEGEKISDIPSLLLRKGDDMPLLLKQAIKGLGEGGQVTAYALAKTIYGDSALPPGTQPFSVMVYKIKILQGAK